MVISIRIQEFLVDTFPLYDGQLYERLVDTLIVELARSVCAEERFNEALTYVAVS